jgi:hypothetical protein
MAADRGDRSERPPPLAGKKGVLMTIPTQDTSRTARLLALMKKGDDAFNARDFATVDTVHHPDMVAYIPGLAEPASRPVNLVIPGTVTAFMHRA